MSSTTPFLTRQPGLTLYALFTILRLIITLPFLLTSLTFPLLRPHPNYTFRQSLAHHLLRTWFEFAATVEFAFPQSLEAGREGDRWVVIEPRVAETEKGGRSWSEFYRRSPLLDEDGEVRPARTGGTWYPKKYEDSKDGNGDDGIVILHFHGGGFVLSDARDANCAAPAQTLLRAMPSSSTFIFFVEYRLSSSPGHRFPAALQDALSAYLYLILDLHIYPSRIVLSGDSAGGNLALGLLRYISENADLFHPYSPATGSSGGGSSPTCAAVLLWSPWLDLSVPAYEFASHANYPTDYVPSSFLSWAQRAYLPPSSSSSPSSPSPSSNLTQTHQLSLSSLSLSHPYISPALHPFLTPTPIWIAVGSHEVLRDQGVKFAADMQRLRMNGNGIGENERIGGKLEVEVCELQDVGHDTFLTGHLTGRQDRAEEGAKSAAGFLEGVMRKREKER